MFNLLIIRIYEIELHAAELSTLATIRRTGKAFLGCIAHTRIAHAKRTVHECFQLHIRHLLVDGTNLV